jgi:dTDP-4-amino-4,6-dideoxygalactose transaminase
VDVDEFGQISIDCIEKAITPRTRVIIPVHYSGQAADLTEILDLAARHGMDVIEDAAHAAGSVYQGRKIGRFGRTTAFSFYATKNMTTGEGGMITTDDEDLADRMRRLALHGMSRDAWRRYTEAGSWYYEVTEAGFKGNMTDLQASIGIHQLRRLDGFISRRQAIASLYTQAFSVLPGVRTPVEQPDRNHTYHLYPIQVDEEKAGLSRSALIDALRAARIGTSVHFVPLHRHPYYRDKFALLPTNFPMAENIYRGLISLPIYPAMVDTDIQDVVEAVQTIFKSASKSTVAA